MEDTVLSEQIKNNAELSDEEITGVTGGKIDAYPTYVNDVKVMSIRVNGIELSCWHTMKQFGTFYEQGNQNGCAGYSYRNEGPQGTNGHGFCDTCSFFHWQSGYHPRW
jgi:hypothetical protein